MLQNSEIDAVTFTSASTVRGFVRAMGENGIDLRQYLRGVYRRADRTGSGRIQDADRNRGSGVNERHGGEDYGTV